MAINPELQYPGKISPSSPGYPYGSARNVTTPGDGTGTPWEAAIVNDLLGFQQALLQAAGVAPSGNPDQVGASQYLDATAVFSGAIVSSLTALKALNGAIAPQAGTAVQIAQGPRAGGFVWDGSDLSVEVTSDPFEGVYVAPDGEDGSSGAWVRQIKYRVSTAWFGLSSSEAAASNLSRLKSAISLTPASARLYVPKDAGDIIVDCTGGLSAAPELPANFALEIDGNLKSNFGAQQANPPFILSAIGDNVSIFGRGSLIGDGTINDANVGDHTDVPGLLHITGNEVNVGGITLDTPAKTAITVVGSRATEIRGVTFAGGVQVYSDTSYFAVRGYQSPDLVVIGNRFKQNASNGKWVNALFLVDCDRFICTANVDEDAFFEKLVYLYGDDAFVAGNNISSVTLTSPFRSNGLRNRFLSNSSDGCPGGLQAFGSVIAQGNSFINCTQTAISVTGSATYSAGGTILAENFLTVVGGTAQDGIDVVTDGQTPNGVHISGGRVICSGGNHGVRVRALSPQAILDVQIIGVDIVGGDYGVLLNRVNRAKVALNMSKDATVSAWGETDCANIEWLDNRAENPASIGIQGLSSTSEGRGNRYGGALLNGAFTLTNAISSPAGRTDIAANAEIQITPKNTPAGVLNAVNGVRAYSNAGDFIIETCNGVAAAGTEEFSFSVIQ